MPLEEIRKKLFQISGEQVFNELAVEIFHYQFETNKVYREFSELLGRTPKSVSTPHDIPFLPISLFRDQEVICRSDRPADIVFTSSGTTGIIPSKHIVRDLKIYEESFDRAFSIFYGNPEEFRFLVLLPGYLERQGSSLVFMMNNLVETSKANGSGFFLHDLRALAEELMRPTGQGIKTMLFGASYALLDFAESPYCTAVNGIVMETGGMKGRKQEIIREELHAILCEKFAVDSIHSEYGMTELLSQGYSAGHGIFRTPPWMKVLIRDINDPLSLLPPGRTGGISIIDLANLHSCSFIATQDLGKVHEDGSFEVLGRFDDSDVRGCNLLVV
jgi:hypothetical protein